MVSYESFIKFIVVSMISFLFRKCGQCKDYNYPNYVRNDPIYTNMELWTKVSTSESIIPCDSCKDDTCSIIPSDPMLFPCYQSSSGINTYFSYLFNPYIPPESAW